MSVELSPRATMADVLAGKAISWSVVVVIVIGVYGRVVTSVTWMMTPRPSVGVWLATMMAAPAFLSEWGRR